jgi:protease IV
MKRSRTGKALLFIFCTIIFFIAILIGASIMTDADRDTSSYSELFDFGNKIGVITIEGTISGSDDILKQIKRFRKRSSIKAIVLRINSPGGTVAPAQEIYREIIRTKAKKPVVASMETVAASAAYYISSSADSIVCSQGTITGSIGVIMMLPDIHKIIEKIGADVNVIKAGKFKDIGSSFRSMSPEERNVLETFAQEIHEQFISDVAEGRKGKIEKEDLRNIADGRFFTGERAKDLGLVDQIGNFYDAVKLAADLGKIKTEPELIYPKKKWDGYLDLFMESAVTSFSKAAEKIKNIQVLAPVIR